MSFINVFAAVMSSSLIGCLLFPLPTVFGLVLPPPTSNKNTTNISPYELSFRPWPQNQHNLVITRIQNDGAQMFKINGTTDKNPSGFESHPLNKMVNYARLTLGHLAASSANRSIKNVQISFNFIVTGDKGQSREISLVDGPTYNVREGWNGDHYYKQIHPQSSNLVLLNNSLLDRVVIIVQKQSSVEGDFLLALK